MILYDHNKGIYILFCVNSKGGLCDHMG